MLMTLTPQHKWQHCRKEVAHQWYRSAVRRSVPLLCDSVATSVGVVVSVINILMEDHAEKMHGTHEHS